MGNATADLPLIIGHQAALVDCSSHHITYLDANSLCATAQSHHLQGRGQSVVAPLQADQLVYSRSRVHCRPICIQTVRKAATICPLQVDL